MIVELGHFAAALALALAAVQGTLPFVLVRRRADAAAALASAAAALQVLCVAAAFAVLIGAYVGSDFSVLNVVENSHSQKPLLYKIAGAWGNHEGSMLLWALVLATFGAAVGFTGGELAPALKARVLAVLGLLGVAFLAFILFTSNPFERVFPPPADGQDLNPLLQDPALAMHPPILYMGYVGLSVAFAFAVAGLLEGRVDRSWARLVKPWVLAAWSALTVGIALGSWWAYYELGWGGFWFWDPVENSSFMPWLIATALLHSVAVVEKRGALKGWTVLLAILGFALSLIGTFLVRSGVLTSVHAFANDPGRGLFILLILVLAIGGAFVLYALRAPRLAAEAHEAPAFAPVSREGALVLNNLLLAVAALTVFLGTLYPLFLDAVGGGKISVGPPYFATTFVPIALALAAAMAVGPTLPWRRASFRDLRRPLASAAALALPLAAGVFYLGAGGAIGLAAATWLAAGTLVELAGRLGIPRVSVAECLARARALPRSSYGMTLAHLGAGVLVAGITAFSAWQEERIAVMRPGERTTLAGYELLFEGVRARNGPNYEAEQGSFTVTRAGTFVALLLPERRLYSVQRRQTTEVAIHTTWLRDIYAVIGDPDGRGGWTVRLYHNPLVPWIWIGAGMIASGGLVSLSSRRRRRASEPAPDAALAPGRQPAE